MPSRRLTASVFGAAAFALAFSAAGFMAHKYQFFPYGFATSVRALLAPPPPQSEREPGLWNRASTQPDAPMGSDAELVAIGYLAGVQAPSGSDWVSYHIPDAVDAGPNLLVSGHGAEALLVDMDGHVLHTWKKPYAEVWPEDSEAHVRQRVEQEYWRCAFVYPNGDLLVIFEYHGLVKLDCQSNVIWKRHVPYHHKLDVAADGRIVTLKQGTVQRPDVRGGERTLADWIAILDSEGNELETISVVDAIANSPFAALLYRTLVSHPDAFHSNSVTVLDHRLEHHGPAFRRGNYLVSVRNTHSVIVIDAESKQVVWSASDLWALQHDPAPTDAGTITVFDNMGLQTRSRVVEFDPRTLEVVWTYEGPENARLFSDTRGTAHTLSNGNVLIAETNAGRAIEVTRDKAIVWEFHSPFRAGENREFVATINDMVRLPRDFPIDWVRNPK